MTRLNIAAAVLGLTAGAVLTYAFLLYVDRSRA